MNDSYQARYEPEDEAARLHRRVEELEAELALSKQLMQSSLDALPVHIAVLDCDGEIVFVNAAWNRFALKQGALIHFGIGSNYLEICEGAVGDEREEAIRAAQGIRDVLNRQVNYFEMEYPCHTPESQKWFEMKVTRCWTQKELYAVVTHENVSYRKMGQSFTGEEED